MTPCTTVHSASRLSHFSLYFLSLRENGCQLSVISRKPHFWPLPCFPENSSVPTHNGDMGVFKEKHPILCNSCCWVFLLLFFFCLDLHFRLFPAIYLQTSHHLFSCPWYYTVTVHEQEEFLFSGVMENGATVIVPMSFCKTNDKYCMHDS